MIDVINRRSKSCHLLVIQLLYQSYNLNIHNNTNSLFISLISCITLAFMSLKILSNNTSFSFHSLLITCLGGLAPLAYCLLFSPDTLTQSSRPCTFPNIWMKWTNILHNGQWNQLPYWLTTLSWWELLGPTHTHIHTQYVPSYHTSFPHWAQQFLGLNFTCLDTSPTTYKATSINKKPSNINNDYSHPLRKSHTILLVECFVLVHTSHLHNLHMH